MKRDAPATSRNRAPILEILRPLLPEGALVLEVASGTGQHAAFLAGALPHVVWQPTDVDRESLESIDAWRAEAGVPNLLPATVLDATSEAWPVARADAIVCINMIHIAPWAACEGLLRGAARVLGPGGVLFLYGPFRIGGALPATSNVAFDASLRARDPAWGVRELDDVTALANSRGFVREALVALPANNHAVVYRRAETSP
jgi:SAM-dependent methyltransferase